MGSHEELLGNWSGKLVVALPEQGPENLINLDSARDQDTEGEAWLPSQLRAKCPFLGLTAHWHRHSTCQGPGQQKLGEKVQA